MRIYSGKTYWHKMLGLPVVVVKRADDKGYWCKILHNGVEILATKSDLEFYQ